MNFAGLLYKNDGRNLGDYFQTLAVEQHTAPVTKAFPREDLSLAKSDVPFYVVMNGNFHHSHLNFPPSPAIRPIYFGFRASGDLYDQIAAKGAHKEHFLANGPIGCRDISTLALMQGQEIACFYSKCLTLTFPQRPAPPSDGKVLLVDIDAKEANIPNTLLEDAQTISHDCSEENLQRLIGLCQDQGLFDKHPRVPDAIWKQMAPPLRELLVARYLLAFYQRFAGLVITTKLHATLPMVAMGIPVIFFHSTLSAEDEGRLQLVEDVGVTRYQLGVSSNEVNWAPKACDFEAEKAKIIAKFRETLHQRRSG